MANLESQLFQGNAGKYQVQESIFECRHCGALYEQPPVISCSECESDPICDSTESKVDAAECSTCGQEVVYTRDNRVNTNYHIFGYLCDDCENILELKFDGQFVDPQEFLQNDLGQGFEVTPVDSDRRETIAWMFSLQTKVEDAGFWSYQPEEFRIWLASVDGTYCGYVGLNSDDKLNQIWVDQGYRRENVATELVKHICEDILVDQEQLVISQATDKGRKFFQSITDDGEVFGKELW